MSAGCLLPHSLSVRVYYEDTDAAGVVYYANYLRYLERGRTELFRALGFELHEWMRRDVVFPVREARLRYRASARLGDLVEVRTFAVAARPMSVVFEADIVRDGTRLTTSWVECACTTLEGKPRRLPEEIEAALQALRPAE